MTVLQKLMDPAEVQNILRNESTIDHVNEATVFFYVWAVVASTGGGYVERFLMSMVKAWGSMAFLLPLVYNVSLLDFSSVFYGFPFPPQLVYKCNVGRWPREGLPPSKIKKISFNFNFKYFPFPYIKINS